MLGCCITIDYTDLARLEMYKKSNKYADMCEKMREAKSHKRLMEESPCYPLDIPDLRRRIIIEDYDFGRVVRHEFELRKTRRIDCYKVIVDGVEWKKSIGWSAVLAGLRKALPRMRSPYA